VLRFGHYKPTGLVGNARLARAAKRGLRVAIIMPKSINTTQCRTSWHTWLQYAGAQHNGTKRERYSHYVLALSTLCIGIPNMAPVCYIVSKLRTSHDSVCGPDTLCRNVGSLRTSHDSVRGPDTLCRDVGILGTSHDSVPNLPSLCRDVLKLGTARHSSARFHTPSGWAELHTEHPYWSKIRPPRVWNPEALFFWVGPAADKNIDNAPTL
jgi:hypothetical protein